MCDRREARGGNCPLELGKEILSIYVCFYEKYDFASMIHFAHLDVMQEVFDVVNNFQKSSPSSEGKFWDANGRKKFEEKQNNSRNFRDQFTFLEQMFAKQYKFLWTPMCPVFTVFVSWLLIFFFYLTTFHLNICRSIKLVWSNLSFVLIIIIIIKCHLLKEGRLSWASI